MGYKTVKSMPNSSRRSYNRAGSVAVARSRTLAAGGPPHHDPWGVRVRRRSSAVRGRCETLASGPRSSQNWKREGPRASRRKGWVASSDFEHVAVGVDHRMPDGPPHLCARCSHRSLTSHRGSYGRRWLGTTADVVVGWRHRHGGMTMSGDDACVIEVALSCRPDRSPAAPRTLDDHIAQGLACIDAGASIVHMHIPDLKLPAPEATEQYLTCFRPWIERDPDVLTLPTNGWGRRSRIALPTNCCSPRREPSVWPSSTQAPRCSAGRGRTARRRPRGSCTPTTMTP